MTRQGAPRFMPSVDWKMQIFIWASALLGHFSKCISEIVFVAFNISGRISGDNYLRFVTTVIYVPNVLPLSLNLVAVRLWKIQVNIPWFNTLTPHEKTKHHSTFRQINNTVPVIWYTELKPMPNRPTFKGSSLFLLLAIS